MYAQNQGAMTQRHPVGGRMLAGLKYIMGFTAGKENIDKRFIETHQAYSSSHFDGYGNHILYPANEKQRIYLSSHLSPADSSDIHVVHKYDFNIDGTVYNVYTRDLSNGKELVTSMWNKTTKEPIDELEILVKKHNNIH